MKSFNEYTKFQKVTVKDKSGKSHTQQTRIRPGTTHVALIHYKAKPKTTFASATPAHTDMNFGTEKSLEKPAVSLSPKKKPRRKGQGLLSKIVKTLTGQSQKMSPSNNKPKPKPRKGPNKARKVNKNFYSLFSSIFRFQSY